MTIPVRIHHDGQTETVFIEEGGSPFQMIRQKVPGFAHTCNGNGTCGKCRIRVGAAQKDALSGPEPNEIRLLGHTQVDAGHRLACMIKINKETELYVETRSRKAKISVETEFELPEPQPAVSKSCLTVLQPSLEDQRSDWARLQSAAFIPSCTDAVGLMRELPAALRAENGRITIVMHADSLAGIQPGNQEKSLYGIAVDIGTTTLAGCLVELGTGTLIGVEAMLNSQRRFGADVISRIHHTMEHPEGATQLHEAIVQDLRLLSSRLCKGSDIGVNDIDEWILTGNTTMGHLLMSWPSTAIAAAPFIPVNVSETVLQAKKLGLAASSHAMATLLPGVSAYVGADTVSAVLACGMNQNEKTALLVDLGTNGELVLGGRNGLIACSTAAGPAFEGAGIRFGMGAVEGAIDRIFLSEATADAPAEIRFSVLGGLKPAGLCGTGLLDAIAILLKIGIIDETGRLQGADDLPDTVPASLAQRCTQLDGQSAYLLVAGKETDQGQDIVLTQRDVREFQNAKAAISAGISTLADVAGITLDAVETVYLAGGLGTWLNPDSAIVTGLIPSELAGRIRSVGNAALAGCTQCLVSTDKRDSAREIATSIRFVELSGRKAFNDRYVDAMMFGDA